MHPYNRFMYSSGTRHFVAVSPKRIKSDIELNPCYKRKQNSKMFYFTAMFQQSILLLKYLYQNVVSGNYSNDT